ncbi:glutathione-disulfide reductase [Luteimonas sp. e5]
MQDFDLIVIGGGSGGLAGAFRAAQHGARVALLEPDEFGGTCVNRGCVPKKVMWLAAELGGHLSSARGLGFELPAQPALDWQQLLLRRSAYIANIHAAYQRRLQEAGIAVFPQRGRLTATPGEVRAGDLLWRAPHILVATGGHALRPAIPGAELAGVSDDFFALQQAPESVALVGGGYIGVELASVLQALGSRVELFVRGPRLLAAFDAEISEKLAESMRQRGIGVHLDTDVAALEQVAQGIRVVAGEAGEAHGPFAQVLFATGRGPNTDGLGLEEAGIRCNAQGQVVVDKWQATSREDVFAVGDVTPQPALTPVAIAAARRLMDRLYGGDDEACLDTGGTPTVVFAHPPLAKLGMTEAEAREAHGDAVSVHRAEFRPMLEALSDGCQRSLFKLVCTGADEKVVGLHLIGAASDEILQGFAVAMRLGMTRRDLSRTLAIHPTSAEEVVLI